MTTGELIKQARQNSKMTQKELAEKVGVSYQMIQAWEITDVIQKLKH